MHIDKDEKKTIIHTMTTRPRNLLSWLLMLAVLLAPMQHVFALSSSHHDENPVVSSSQPGHGSMQAEAGGDDAHCGAGDVFNNGNCNGCDKCAHCAAPPPPVAKAAPDGVADSPLPVWASFHSLVLSPEHRPPKRG